MEDPKQQFVTHIENSRLWGLAGGRIRVEKWEQGHLHGCRVCQGVLYAYLDQPTTTSIRHPAGIRRRRSLACRERHGHATLRSR